MPEKHHLSWYDDDCDVDDRDSNGSSGSSSDDSDLLTGWDLLEAIWSVI